MTTFPLSGVRVQFSPRFLPWAEQSLRDEIGQGMPVLSSTFTSRHIARAVHEIRAEDLNRLIHGLVYGYWDDVRDEDKTFITDFHDRLRTLFRSQDISTFVTSKPLPARTVKAIAVPKLEALLGERHRAGDEGERVWTCTIGKHEITTSVEIRKAPYYSMRYWHRVPALGSYTGLGAMSILCAWGLVSETSWISFSEAECHHQVDVLCSVIRSFLDARPWEPSEPTA